MACPFFMPMEKLVNGLWPHPSRLPLGCGWSGHCTAPGHEGEMPSEEELRDLCNLGYAEGCSRLPHDRSWDTVRFNARAVASEDKASVNRIHVRYVCERGHLPADHGLLEFDTSLGWTQQHPDSRVQRMAECFIESYLEKAGNCRVAQAAAS